MLYLLVVCQAKRCPMMAITTNRVGRSSTDRRPIGLVFLFQMQSPLDSTKRPAATSGSASAGQANDTPHGRDLFPPVDDGSDGRIVCRHLAVAASSARGSTPGLTGAHHLFAPSCGQDVVETAQPDSSIVSTGYDTSRRTPFRV